MRRINLGNKLFALIDNEDFELVGQFTWYASYDIRRKDYYVVCSKLRTKLHRFLMKAKHGQAIDHVNGDPLDNRRCNLRFCTTSQNHMNRSKTKRQCLSMFKGVSRHKLNNNRWIAHIGFNKKSIHLGYFDSEIDAARAYDKKAIELFKNFAKLNFSCCWTCNEPMILTNKGWSCSCHR